MAPPTAREFVIPNVSQQHSCELTQACIMDLLNLRHVSARRYAPTLDGVTSVTDPMGN